MALKKRNLSPNTLPLAVSITKFNLIKKRTLEGGAGPRNGVVSWTHGL